MGARKPGLSPPPSIFILIVPRRYFCCGSLLFLLSVFILWFSYYGLKTLLHQGLSEPEFYGDLVYKFKKIVGRVVFFFFCCFFDQFRKIIVRYKRIGYNINIMRQSACLVINPITVNNFASLFNCPPVGRASDSMMAPT